VRAADASARRRGAHRRTGGAAGRRPGAGPRAGSRWRTRGPRRRGRRRPLARHDGRPCVTRQEHAAARSRAARRVLLTLPGTPRLPGSGRTRLGDGPAAVRGATLVAMTPSADPLRSFERAVLWQAQLPAQPDRRGGRFLTSQTLWSSAAGCRLRGRAARRSARGTRGAPGGRVDRLGRIVAQRRHVPSRLQVGSGELMVRHGAILGEAIHGNPWTPSSGPPRPSTRRRSRPTSSAPGTWSSPMRRRTSRTRHAAASSRPWARSPARCGFRAAGRDRHRRALRGLLVERSVDSSREVRRRPGVRAERAGASLYEGVRVLRAAAGRRPGHGRDDGRSGDCPRGVRRDERLYGRGGPELRRRVLPIGSYIIATEPLSEDLAHELSRTVGCSSTRRTSSTTGASLPTAGCCWRARLVLAVGMEKTARLLHQACSVHRSSAAFELRTLGAASSGSRSTGCPTSVAWAV